MNFLLLINIIIILLHESTDLNVFDEINNVIRDSKLTNSIYIDVYSESNDTTTGRDNRLAIVHPFNWYLFNSRSNVYVYSTSQNYQGTLCDGNDSNTFLKLKNPLSGQSLQNIHRVCLPVTVSTMVTHFASKPRARLYFDTNKNKIDIIDIVDYLLVKGAFTNCIVK